MENQGKQQVQLTKDQIIGMVIKNLGEIKVPVSLYDEVSVPIINGIENLFLALELCKKENEKVREIIAENEMLKAGQETQNAPVKKPDDACENQIEMNLEPEVEEENQNGTES